MSDNQPRLPSPLPVGICLRDHDTGHDVVYTGDHGHGPWFHDETDGHDFYCDWCDVYLWGRFEPR